MNNLFDFSDAEILEHLSRVPGRLHSFLLGIPTNELEDALQQKRNQQDQEYLQSRNRAQNIHKQNVLDYTLEEVIKANNRQKIINYFQYTLALKSSRLQNHPCYGMRLVRSFPQKYYVGQRSSHYNHAREIQQLYGVERNNHSERSQQANSQHDRPAEQEGNNNEEEQQKKANNSQDNQQQQEKQQENFIVDDSLVLQLQQSDIIDDLEAIIKLKKKKQKQKLLKQKNKSKKQTIKRQNNKSQKKNTKTKPIQKNQFIRRLKKAKINNDKIQKQYINIQSSQNDYDPQSNDSDSAKALLIQDQYITKYSNKNSQQVLNQKLNELIFKQLQTQKKQQNSRKNKMNKKKKMNIDSDEDQD